ncbi:MAG: hypothetical protein ABJE95_14345 [Byssovorax sp.]
MTDPRAPTPAARVIQWLRANWLDVLCLAVVVAMAVKLVWSVDTAHDLMLDDEAIQLERGFRLFHPGDPNGPHGLPPPDYGPVYSFWYAFLHLFVRDPIRLYYVSYSCLVAMISAALYALSRALDAAPVAALVATFLFLVSHVPLIMPYAAHFATLVVFVGCVLAARASTLRRALRWVLVAMILATYVRPELALAFFVVALVAAWLAWRALRRNQVELRAIALEMLGFALAVGALVLVLGEPLGGGRAFFAFGQHYARNVVERDHLTANPWLSYPTFVKQDFGDVTSVAGAARANPSAFARHVLRNVTNLPACFRNVIQPVLLLGLLFGKGASRVTSDVAALFAVAGSIAGAWALWARRKIEPQRAAVLLGFAGIMAASLASALLVYPREHYVLSPLAVMLVLAGVGATVVAQKLAARVRRDTAPRADRLPWPAIATVAISAFLLAIVPSIAHGWCLQTVLSGVTIRPTPPSDALPTARAIARFGIKERVVFLEPRWGYALFSGLEYARLYPGQKDQPFGRFLEAKAIGIIVLTDYYAQDPSFDGDPEFKAFLADPARSGFRLVDVPGSTTRVAVRESLLPN